MGAYPVVLQPPDLRLYLSLGKRVKHLHVQNFISDFGVEALDKAVLPWFPRLGMGFFGSFLTGGFEGLVESLPPPLMG